MFLCVAISSGNRSSSNSCKTPGARGSTTVLFVFLNVVFDLESSDLCCKVT